MHEEVHKEEDQEVHEEEVQEVDEEEDQERASNPVQIVDQEKAEGAATD